MMRPPSSTQEFCQLAVFSLGSRELSGPPGYSLQTQTLNACRQQGPLSKVGGQLLPQFWRTRHCFTGSFKGFRGPTARLPLETNSKTELPAVNLSRASWRDRQTPGVSAV